VAFRSSSSNAGNASSLEITAPSGIQEGDILIAFWSQGGSGSATITWPDGFTLLDSVLVPAADNTNRVAIKVATSSEPSSYTISSNASDYCVAGIAAFSGRDTEATPTVQTTSAPTAVEAPIAVDLAGVTAAEGDDIVWIGMRVPSAGGSLTSPLWTPPSSYTERIDQNAAFYISASLATRDNVSAGATGTLSGTIGASDDAGYAGFVIALPAAGGGEPEEATGTGSFAADLVLAQDGDGIVANRKLLLTEAVGRELRDNNRQPVANLSGIKFEWYDKTTDTEGNPDVTGTFDTNESGEAIIPLFGSGLSAEDEGILILEHPSDDEVRGVYRLPVS
jgi:hypothetical protein